MKKLLSICAVPLLGAALLAAQDQPAASSTDPQSGEKTQSSVPQRAEDNKDWGWIGLLGLLGLAGLRGKRRGDVVHMQETSRDYSGDVRRAG